MVAKTEEGGSSEAMAAMRVMAAGSLHSLPTGGGGGGAVLLRRGAYGGCGRSSLPAGSRRRLCCKALYRPELVTVREDGPPETLDYRVFFVDDAGKKVCFFFFFFF